MMGLFIISKLLLATLLLQPTKEELKKQSPTEADSSTLFDEFCLRLTNEPHWTSSESPNQPRSTRPTNHAAKQLEQPTAETHLDSQLAKPTTEPIPASYARHKPTVEVDEPDIEAVAPLSMTKGIGCECQDKEKKPLDDIVGIIVMVVTEYPSDECNSYESYAILQNDIKVCVIASSLLKVYARLQRPRTATEKKKGTSPAPIGPTPTKGTPNIWVPGTRYCGPCSFVTDLDNVGPTGVPFLTVRRPISCPQHIHINLNDREKNCLDSNQPNFEEMLTKLEKTLLPQTPENIFDGCRCKEMKWRTRGETSPVNSTRIWPGGERCSHTEFIETLMDGRVVCAMADSLSEYLRLPVPSLGPGSKNPSEGARDERPNKERDQFIGRDEPPPACNECITIESWELVDPQDIQSVQMEIQPLGCPILIHVRRQHGGHFCEKSSRPMFRALLERLDA